MSNNGTSARLSDIWHGYVAPLADTVGLSLLTKPAEYSVRDYRKNHRESVNRLKKSLDKSNKLADAVFNPFQPGSTKLSAEDREKDKKARAAIAADLRKKYGRVDPKLFRAQYTAMTGEGKSFNAAVNDAKNKIRESWTDFAVKSAKRALVISGALGVGATGGYAVAKYLNKPYINPTATALLTGLGSSWLADYMYRKFNTTN